MSTKNKKNLASQALLEMDAITSAIKEESKNTLNTLLSEAIRDALREGCEEEEDKEYDIVDDENDAEDNDENAEEAKSDVDETNDSEMSDETAVPNNNTQMEPDAMPQNEPENGADDENWNEFSQYQAGENTYDLTGEDDYEKVVKVYKLLKDEDQVVIKQDGNTIQLSDNETGAEYVIDLGDENEEPEVEVMDSEEAPNSEMNLNESDIAGFDSDFDINDDLDDENEFDMENNFGEDELEDIKMTIDALRQKVNDLEGETNNIYENRKTKKSMKESKEVLFEVDLGYTDSYQDKDPIAGLSNDEPSKNGKSWHKGVPTGTKKPWAGTTKSKGEPFGKIVSEEDEFGDEIPMEEAAMSTSSQSVAKKTKTRTSAPRRENARKVAKSISTAEKGYEDVVNENKMLKKQVKELKEAVIAIRKNLSEAYITNANLGKITKLFLENTTSQNEKIDIVNRFSNEAKTIEQSKALYESIKRELSKSNPTLNINESVTANGSKMLNENKVYKSVDLIKTIDFMNRVMNY